ncbi:hypothetical protein [Pseudidiomarina halophila]|uniref:hypothetical protein n=1 Tax=Pseudidiomarina halophila TaxID=1449799 RepID=UPI00361C5B7C
MELQVHTGLRHLPGGVQIDQAEQLFVLEFLLVEAEGGRSAADEVLPVLGRRAFFADLHQLFGQRIGSYPRQGAVPCRSRD